MTSLKGFRCNYRVIGTYQHKDGELHYDSYDTYTMLESEEIAHEFVRDGAMYADIYTIDENGGLLTGVRTIT